MNNYLINWFMDVEARLRGRCNATPDVGGYAFWRCGWKARHTGSHRYNNYIWKQGERVQYSPVSWNPPRLIRERRLVQRR